MKVDKPFWKFFIGLVAGLCAAFLPRLTAALAMSEDSGGFRFFATDYVGLSLFFALLIGVVIMILEWGIPAKPRDTFMAALGIPALITGAINTATVANSLRDVEQENEKLTRALSQQADIPVLPSGPIHPGPNSGLFQPKQAPMGLSFLGPRAVHAGDKDHDSIGRFVFDIGIKAEEPRYTIILDTGQTEEEAKEKAEDLRSIVPEVQVVPKDNRFLVIQGGDPRKKSDALLEAIRLRGLRNNLKPSLLPVP